jgi:hypothetical protein
MRQTWGGSGAAPRAGPAHLASLPASSCSDAHTVSSARPPGRSARPSSASSRRRRAREATWCSTACARAAGVSRRARRPACLERMPRCGDLPASGAGRRSRRTGRGRAPGQLRTGRHQQRPCMRQARIVHARTARPDPDSMHSAPCNTPRVSNTLVCLEPDASAGRIPRTARRRMRPSGWAASARRRPPRLRSGRRSSRRGRAARPSALPPLPPGRASGQGPAWRCRGARQSTCLRPARRLSQTNAKSLSTPPLHKCTRLAFWVLDAGGDTGAPLPQPTSATTAPFGRPARNSRTCSTRAPQVTRRHSSIRTFLPYKAAFLPNTQRMRATESAHAVRPAQTPRTERALGHTAKRVSLKCAAMASYTACTCAASSAAASASPRSPGLSGRAPASAAARLSAHTARPVRAAGAPAPALAAAPRPRPASAARSAAAPGPATPSPASASGSPWSPGRAPTGAAECGHALAEPERARAGSRAAATAGAAAHWSAHAAAAAPTPAPASGSSRADPSSLEGAAAAAAAAAASSSARRVGGMPPPWLSHASGHAHAQGPSRTWARAPAARRLRPCAHASSREPAAGGVSMPGHAGLAHSAPAGRPGYMCHATCAADERGARRAAPQKLPSDRLRPTRVCLAARMPVAWRTT